MQFLNFLNKLLDVANFEETKRKKFVEVFYQYYYSRLVDAIGGIDPSSGQRFMRSVDNMRDNPEAFGLLWKELIAREDFKAKIDEVTDEVVGYLMSDVIKSASDEDKAQLASALRV